MDETNEPDERARPPALTPVDEAMLARAHTLMQIVEAGLRDVSERYRDDDHGRVLRDALFMQGLADDLVTKAVIAERERGASWTAIGNAADISQQSAHKRWNTKVAAWVLMGRQRSGIGRGDADPAAHAQYLGEWLDTLVGKGRDAISRLLPSLYDEAARQEANDRRAEVKRLRERTEELRRECDAAHAAVMEAAGTDAAEEKQAVWAARHFARADIFERLAAIEEPAAAEHRRTAATLRSIAEDILRRDGLDSEAPATTQKGALQ